MWCESSGVRYGSPESLSSLALASASNDGTVKVCYGHAAADYRS